MKDEWGGKILKESAPALNEDKKSASINWLRTPFQALWVVLAIFSLLILVFILAEAVSGGFSELVSYTSGQPGGTEPTGIEYTFSVLGIVFALLTAFLSIGLAGLLFWRRRDDNMVKWRP